MCVWPQLHPAVLQVLDLVDTDEPVLRRVRLLQHVQLKILVADLRIAHTVIACWLAWDKRKTVTTTLCLMKKTIISTLCWILDQSLRRPMPLMSVGNKDKTTSLSVDYDSFTLSCTDDHKLIYHAKQTHLSAGGTTQS